MAKSTSLGLLAGLVFVCITASSQDNIARTTPENHYNFTSENNGLIVTQDKIKADTSKRERKHYPQVATICSTVLPGLGQVYNRKYWKVPLIWGGGLALYSYFDWNNAYFHRFKLADEQLSNEMPVTDPELSTLESGTITSYKNLYRRRRDKAVILMGVLYAANIVDALVDAHMLDYDISEDLSLHWEPTLLPATPDYYSPTENYALGAKIQLKF